LNIRLKNIPYSIIAGDLYKEQGRTFLTALLLGIAILTAAIVLGHKYVAIPILVIAPFITFIWRKSHYPWILMVSMLASSPVYITKQAIQPNLIFAFWLLILQPRLLFRLPIWIYVLTCLVLFGFFTSAINWISDNFVRSLAQQLAYAYSYLLGPFLLLPVIFSRMEMSRDNSENLRGLLYALIVPSTLMLFLAKKIGTPYVQKGVFIEGFFSYKLGAVSVSFLRTQVGFIFATLICATTAIVVSKVKLQYRLLSAACLILNFILLLSTGSVGSMTSCFCGLAAMFCVQMRMLSISRVLLSVAVIICMLFLTWELTPDSVKKYLEHHFEERANQGEKQDRFMLWGRALDQIVSHPEGVGWTLLVGEGKKSYTHNQYLGYSVSYGVIGGIAYVSLTMGLMIYFFTFRRREVEDHSSYAIILVGLGVCVALAVNSMTDTISPNKWYFTTIWSLIWYCYFSSRDVHAGKRIGSDTNIFTA